MVTNTITAKKKKNTIRCKKTSCNKSFKAYLNCTNLEESSTTPDPAHTKALIPCIALWEQNIFLGQSYSTVTNCLSGYEYRIFFFC